ncbi:uncharacterized protein TM35_000033660 [Trypanosoma theileri]|uniref:Uncharacterized protein n=1 Tax=Trypanosoma theileri TaxID=67003 RepID=A0A1X0P7L2_9TRYP|nr:uncharacterized protein TM35_000033660 [Trypanosoma theileri]ORC92613.1 hypothetical protein TM35_000033660 [Trypanosoma theileri]
MRRCPRGLPLFVGPRRSSHHQQQSPPPLHPPAIRGEEEEARAWLQEHVDRAVAEGRQPQAVAAYFDGLLDDRPELRAYVRDARQQLGGTDPRALTAHQQRTAADRLARRMSSDAAARLLRAHNEDTHARQHAHDGTPTGEAYWVEAGGTLASPAVPRRVKDEVLRDMQADRQATSPAFDEPPETATLAAKDANFAQHLREQRRRLLRPDDWLD